MYFPGSISAVIIDPRIIEELGNSIVFSTISGFYYPLSDSTLIDNCNILYVVNRKELLEQGTFKEA